MAPPPRTELKWAAIDLDGTLAKSCWVPGMSDPLPIGEPITENRWKLLPLRRDGWKIVIYTARPWSDYEYIEWWLNHHGISFDRIVCGKLLAGIYIDDRAANASEDDWTRGQPRRREG